MYSLEGGDGYISTRATYAQGGPAPTLSPLCSLRRVAQIAGAAEKTFNGRVAISLEYLMSKPTLVDEKHILCSIPIYLLYLTMIYNVFFVKFL